MPGQLKYTHGKWRNILSMEYWCDNGKHHRKPNVNNNLFRDGNKFKWLFENNFSNRFCRIICYRDCDRITGINLYRRIKYTHGQWHDIVSMEYRSDDCKHHGESGFNYNIFSYWNKCEWMFRRCFGNGNCQHLTERHRLRIAIHDLCRRFINVNGEWCFNLSMEYRADHSHHYSKSRFNYYLFCHRN